MLFVQYRFSCGKCCVTIETDGVNKQHEITPSSIEHMDELGWKILRWRRDRQAAGCSQVTLVREIIDLWRYDNFYLSRRNYLTKLPCLT